MIQVNGLTVGYEKPVLTELSVTIQDGEFCVLIGKNGSGKSTFLQALLGLVETKSGTISINGLHSSNVDDLPFLRKEIGFLFQNPEDQIIAPTVEEEVAFGAENLSLDLGEMEERIQEALSLTKLVSFRNRLTQELSGGEKQRLALAGILAMKPEIFFLDEPTSLIDLASKQELFKILKDLHARGKTILMVTHELEEIFWGEKLFVLHEGKILVVERPAEIFSDPRLSQEWELEVPYELQLDFLLRGFQERYPELSTFAS